MHMPYESNLCHFSEFIYGLMAICTTKQKICRNRNEFHRIHRVLPNRDLSGRAVLFSDLFGGAALRDLHLGDQVGLRMEEAGLG